MTTLSDLASLPTPAVIDRGEVVAAIGTGGASPMLATMLRWCGALPLLGTICIPRGGRCRGRQPGTRACAHQRAG